MKKEHIGGGVVIVILLFWFFGSQESTKQKPSRQNTKTTVNAKYEPYTVMGISIKGKIMEVVEQFKSIGFVMIEHNANSIVRQDQPDTYQIIMNNDDGNTVGLQYDTETQSIYGVGIFMPVSENWSYLHGAYSSARNGLIKLYGQVTPDRDFTSFYRPYRKGDGNEIEAILTNNCKYKSYWSLPNTALSITISNTCQVGVVAGLKYNSITLD